MFWKYILFQNILVEITIFKQKHINRSRGNIVALAYIKERFKREGTVWQGKNQTRYGKERESLRVLALL